MRKPTIEPYSPFTPTRRKRGQNNLQAIIVVAGIAMGLWVIGYQAWSAINYVKGVDAQVTQMMAGEGIR